MADIVTHEAPAADSADSQEFPLTEEWLVAQSFEFRAEPSGETLSRGLTLLPNGAIGGYDHPNERRWSLVEGQLRVLSDTGFATCCYTFAGRRTGRVSLSGEFRDPRRPGTPSGVMHFLHEVDRAARPDIQTFDLFDTLIARRCIYPLEVFHAVERKAGIASFAELRHRVEMQMFGQRPYGLDDIYAAISQASGWSQQVVGRLRMLELAEEWNSYFPICEVIAKVRPQDMIISDMYLPYDFVRKILTVKCGLANPLYLSNYGKHHAIVWSELAPRYRITRHHGDNLQTDIHSPSRFGVPAVHVTAANLSPAEKILCDIGLRPQAETIREARLGLHDPAQAVLAVQQAQLQVNLPLLLVGTYYLLDRARELGADSLLLCARDCNLWVSLMRLLAQGLPRRPRIHYVAASRAAFYSDSPEYDAYFHHFLGERNLLVDVVGTGRSPAHFLQRSGLAERVASFVLVGAPDAEMQGSVRVETLLKREFRPFRLALEALNLSLEGSALGGRLAEFELSVARAPNEFDIMGQQLIAAQQRAFLEALRILATHADCFSPPPREALSAAAAALLDLLPAQLPALEELSRQILANLA